MKENGCHWSFQEWNSQISYVGPNDAIIQSFNKDFYDSLVRESIQNSLDAVLDKTKPVKVSFKFDSINSSDYPELFSLRKHIEGCLKMHEHIQRARDLYKPMLQILPKGINASMDIITVSDSNTSGMEYDENNPQNKFSAFAKSVGLSIKSSQTSGGSFGFGKAAYFQMSPFRSILVSSMTPTGESYFEGVTRLCTHEMDGVKYTDVGYYDNRDGKPVIGSDIPEKFRRAEPGTSITLLGKYPDAGSIKEMEEKLLKAVLKNFWLAIYEQKLEVCIGNSLVLTKMEIGRMIPKHFPANDKDKTSPREYFEAYTHAEDKQHLRFEGSTPNLGAVKLFVELNSAGRKDRIAYMREPMMLVNVKNLSTHFGLNALFLCLDEKGNTILSNMEDASHTSWTAAGKTGDARKKAQEAIREIDEFVKSCLDQIFDSSGDIEVIDIGIGFSEKDVEDLLANNSERNNPFGTVRTGEIAEEGGDLTTTETDSKTNKKSDKSKGNIGKDARGKADADNAVKKLIGTGHGDKPAKRHGGKGTSGTSQRITTPKIEDNGEKFSLYTPSSYRTPAYIENGEWFHDIILHVEEDMDNAFIEIKVGTEDGDDSLSIASTSLGKAVSGKGIIKFDHLSKGKIIIKVQFTDKQRHTIKLR